MEIGDVIIKDDNIDVIVEARSDGGYTVISLERFVMRDVVIKHDGEYKTIAEVVEDYCDKYISGATVHER